jgi:hypothetical protein
LIVCPAPAPILVLAPNRLLDTDPVARTTPVTIEGDEVTVLLETATGKDGIEEMKRKKNMSDPITDGMTTMTDIQNDGDDETAETETTRRSKG